MPLEEHIKVLGVAVDRCLRFDHHVAAVARQTSQRVSALRRMAGNLDFHGILTLYKAQIRPCMEYDVLIWMSSAITHVQRRALRLVYSNEHQQPAYILSLEHRRHMSVLVIFHKAQVQEVPHLGRLRFTPRPAQRWIRAALINAELMEVPRSHSRKHQRTFTTMIARLWNRFMAATPHVPNMSTATGIVARKTRH